MSAHDKLKTISIEGRKDLHFTSNILRGHRINAYYGWVGYGNLGDEAVYEASRINFSKLSFEACRIKGYLSVLNRVVNSQPPIRNAMLGGGTLINQSKSWLEYVEYSIDNLLPTFCLGTGVASKEFWQYHEHIHTADDMKRWAKVLKKFIYVGVRGPMSMKALTDKGVTAEIVGDAAFALAPSRYKHKKNVRVIGLSISRGTDNAMWGNQDELLNEMVKAVTELTNSKIEVRLFPIWPADDEISQELIRRCGSNLCSTVKAYQNVQTYLNAIEQCDLFIGEKLHATVFSTMLRIPSLMLEYRPKCLDFMQSIDMEEYSMRTDKITSAILLDKIELLTQNYQLIQSKLNDRTMYYRNLQKIKAAFIMNQIK